MEEFILAVALVIGFFILSNSSLKGKLDLVKRFQYLFQFGKSWFAFYGNSKAQSSFEI